MPEKSLGQLRAELRKVPPGEVTGVNFATKKTLRKRAFMNEIRAKCHVENLEVIKLEELKDRVSSTFLVSVLGPASGVLNLVTWVDRRQTLINIEMEFR